MEFRADDRPGALTSTKVSRPQHSELYLKTVYACGERREHLVRVHRSQWPPKPNPSVNDRPYLTRHCERCGAVVIVYNPPAADLTVVLYGDAGEVAGRVVDDAGTVVDEPEASAAGQVVEEADSPPGRRRGR